jgi:ankyrin repeat protein/Tol biopolymer transport system component
MFVQLMFSQTIHRSACDGNLERVDSLLQTMDVNVLDDKGRTSLLYAVGCRRPKVFDLLLAKGADVNLGDQNGLYPILMAAEQQHEKFIDSLIAYGVNVNTKDIHGNTPLLLSVIRGDVQQTQKFINANAQIDTKNQRGNTALAIAMREGYDSIAQTLLSEGADKRMVKKVQLKGKFMGQKVPGLTPQIFAPEVVSVENYVHTGVFYPDGSEFYFSKSLPKIRSEVIMVSKKKGTTWTSPERLSIFGDRNEFDTFITHDGNRLFFCSNKKIRETDTISNADLWMMKRIGDSWGKPIHLGNELNSQGNEWFPTVSKKGTLVFSVNVGRKSTIYYSKWKDGAYQQPMAFDENINSGGYDYDPMIAPDESYLIFASGREGGFGANDLYISFKRKDGSWTPAKNMGEKINSKTTEYAASLSPDGNYLFFTSNIAGSSDLYWVSSQIIEELRPKN